MELETKMPRGEVFIENPAAYERAKEAYIKANAAKTRRAKFNAAHPNHEAIIEFIRSQAMRGNEFWSSVWEGVEQYGAPRERIVEIVEERMAKAEERKAQWKAEEAKSQWFGEVGKRIEFEAKCYFEASFEGTFGYVYITGYRTPEGNIVIHKGSVNRAEKGRSYKIKATIKSHGEREGVKQTMISRPVISELEVQQ